jgi:hypothetical protein
MATFGFFGNKPAEYLQTPKENLEMAKIHADYHSEVEHKCYAYHYNLRSTLTASIEMGNMVIVLTPDIAA